MPDGPGCKWEDGSFQRIEAQNRAALKAAEKARAEVAASPVTRASAPPLRQPLPLPIADDGGIPEFLRRA